MPFWPFLISDVTLLRGSSPTSFQKELDILKEEEKQVRLK